MTKVYARELAKSTWRADAAGPGREGETAQRVLPLSRFDVEKYPLAWHFLFCRSYIPTATVGVSLLHTPPDADGVCSPY